MTDVAFRGEVMRVAREAYVTGDEVVDVLRCPHCCRRRVRAVVCPVFREFLDVRVECFGCELLWRMSVTPGGLGLAVQAGALGASARIRR